MQRFPHTTTTFLRFSPPSLLEELLEGFPLSISLGSCQPWLFFTFSFLTKVKRVNEREKNKERRSGALGALRYNP